jgi:hypothetical protein
MELPVLNLILFRGAIMNGRIRIPLIAAIALFLGTSGAFAQTVGSDEAVNPDGIVAQELVFTAAQKSAIYTAIMQHKVRASTPAVAAAVGAPVPPTIALSDLPDQVVNGQPWAELLKYAMVEGDVVVVDPIAMRVVDIIPGSARP